MNRRYIVALLLAMMMVCVIGVSALPSLRAPDKVYIEKTSLELGEKNTIGAFTNSKDTSLVILNVDTKKTHKYLTIDGDIEFLAQTEGTYKVMLVNLSSEKIIDETQFLVSPTPKRIFTDKTSYELFEDVIITAQGFETGDKIIINSSMINYVILNPSEKNKFKPQIIGEYTAIYKSSENQAISQTQFLVKDEFKTTSENTTQSSQPDYPAPIRYLLNLLSKFGYGEKSETKGISIKITDARGDKKDALLQIYDSGNIIDNPIENTRYAKAIIKIKGAVDEIELYDLNYESSFDLRISDVPKQKVAKDIGKYAQDQNGIASLAKTYAINPEKITFSSGKVTATASGTKLYKCKEWNFDEETCNGEWAYVKNIVPGEQYTIDLGPNDPAYAETGVSSVNTKKPVYHPIEVVDLTVVILDQQGYPTNDANIIMTITSPDGVTTTYSNHLIDTLSLIHESNGIYSAEYTDTSNTGTYIVTINAQGDGVDSEFSTYFEVRNFYEYDIIRSAPVSIDPWLGPFSSTIRITSLNGMDIDSFTEVIPGNFEIIDNGGASIDYDGKSTYLTWNVGSMTGEVTYIVQAPLVTPDLYALGQSYVTYNNTQIFYEARPWYLAIDPIYETQKGILIYADTTDNIPSQRNWTGISIQAEEKLATTTGSTIFWQKFRCMKKYPVCLLASLQTDNSLDFQVFNTQTRTWSDFNTLDANIGFDDTRAFDIECEDTSGRCMIAYETASTNNNQFSYNIWNGTALSTATAVTVSSAGNSYFNWIELYPEVGTNNIGIGLQQEGGNPSPVQAGFWNGTAFVNWQQMTANSQDRSDRKHFGCGWEETSDQFTCFFGNDATSTLNAYTYDKVSWTSLGTIYTPDGKVEEVSSCGSNQLNSGSASDHIGVIFCEANAYRDGGIWNGTAFSKSTTRDLPDRDASSECAGRKGNAIRAINADCMIEKTKDKIIFAWSDDGDDYSSSGTYTISSKSWSMTTWDGGAQIGTDAAADVRGITLIPNPTNNEIGFVQHDNSNDLLCAIWDGSTFDGSNCGTVETSGTSADYVFYGFDWHRYVIQPDIIINLPRNEEKNYNYTSITNPSTTSRAFEGNSTNYPLTSAESPTIITEITTTGYTQIASLDGNDLRTTLTSSGGLHAYHGFKFSTTTSTSDIMTVTFTHRGHATQGTALAASQFSIYVYNYSSDSYLLLRTVNANPNDITTNSIISTGFSDFVQNGELWFLAMGVFATGGGASSRADLWTDYAAVNIETIPSLRGISPINATVMDDEGVSACKYIIQNETFSSGLIGLNKSGNDYINNSNTTLLPDGKHNLTVSCNDTLNNRLNATMEIRINNEVPKVELMSPIDGVNLTMSTINFTWNASNSQGSSFLCNHTLDNVIRFANVVVDSGNNVTKTISSISDGTHYWNVSCSDAGGNKGYSSTWRLDIDTAAPTVALNLPLNYVNLSNSTTTFSYTPNDAHQIINCSLIINNALIDTNTTITRSALNYFNATLADESYNWSINCTDSFGFLGNSSKRSFSIDTQYPWVNLTTPSDITFENGTAILNYTVFDNMDRNVTCNLTINNVVQRTNINSGNNTPISINLTMPDGLKLWNVTCWDDSRNTNTSETRTFTLVGAPYVQLNSPSDLGQNIGVNTTLAYYVGDGDGIFNCTLFVDDVENQTANGGQITNFANNTFKVNYMSEGWHNWTVRCIDWMISDYTYTPAYRLYIDKTKPWANLNSPAAGSLLTAYITTLNFTAFDAVSENMTCNVTIDDVVKASNVFSKNNTPTTASTTLTNGLHWWNVTCLDFSGNMNISNNWNFTTNVTFPVNVTVLADKQSYQQGETAYINTTTRNETKGPLSTSVVTDIIYTNETYTSTVWWNTSWERRFPIRISNQLSSIETGAVLANITGLSGYITGCQEEIRVVELDTNGFGNKIGRSIIGGDDSTFCTIMFLATNISANANNQSGYFVYFNNSNAIADSDVNFTAQTTYDFAGGGGTDSAIAFELDSNDDPPLSVNSRIELLTADYTSVGISDEGRWQTIDPGNGDYVSMEIIMQINESLSNLNEINLFIEGQPSVTGVVKLYAWSSFANSWDYLDQKSLASGADDTLNASITSSLSNYVNSTGHIRWLAIYGTASEYLLIDYVKTTTIYNDFSQNLSTSIGSIQKLINQTSNNTGASGKYDRTLDTTGKITGNYSAVSGATTAGYRFGFGFDFFEIIGDVFGPQVTLVNPQTGFTNRTMNVTFTFSANDVATGINACSLILNNELNQTISPITEGQQYNFTFNDTPQGYYTWTVNCTDLNGNVGQGTPIRYFTIDNTAPSISGLWPDDIAVSTNNVRFNFTAIDNFAASMTCNVSVDDGAYFKETAATNNTVTSVVINSIPNGLHLWNVTCFDNAKNKATSYLANVTVDALPIVVLDSPINGFGTNITENITFYFNYSDSRADHCSLILDNNLNQTKDTTEAPFSGFNGTNNFTIAQMSIGSHNWSVNCTDTFGFTGSSNTWEIQIDLSEPFINLSYPLNDTELFTKTVNFRFTAFDDADGLLNCTLNLNGEENTTGIAAYNGVEKVVPVGGFGPSNNEWNVTCFDNTGHVNTSDNLIFNISSKVNVLIISPANNSADRDGNIDFVFKPQSVAEFDLGWCDFYIDNSWLDTKVAPVNDQNNNFSRTGLAEGNHTWFVNCTDNYGTSEKSNVYSVMIDKIDPYIISFYPSSHFFTTSTVYFNWTAYDNVAEQLLCNVSINGTRMATDIISNNGSVANTTISGIVDGLLPWNVSCVDTSGRVNTSNTLTLNVQEPPTISLNSPGPGLRTKIVDVSFYFTPSDNSRAIKNCTLILNGERNVTKTVINNSLENNITSPNLPDNQYNWSVNCTDPSGNTANSSTRTMYVDLFPPWINLTKPVEGQAFNTDDILFNWTATDQWGTNLWCNLTVDDVLNQTSLTATSGVPKNFLIENMTLGPHNYSIICWDDLYWSNSTNTTTFIVNAPDLTLNDSDISFNNTMPDKNENITLYATIYNKGGYPAYNALVEFWDGDPALGVLIANATIPSLDPLMNNTVNVSWEITDGAHNIWVVIDKNNLIVEEDELNNNATSNISLLSSIINYPANGTWTNNLTIDFSVFMAAFAGSTIDYRTFINGALSGPSGAVNDNTTNTIPITFTEGLKKVFIEVNDSNNRMKNSTELTLYIDLSAPTITIQTLNNTWFNTGNPLIRFLINDNLDNFLNYTLYLDGSVNSSDVANKSVNWNTTITDLTNGSYHISISSYDDAGNVQNTSNITIYIDTVFPTITLNHPQDDANYTVGNPELNFTATDNMDLNLTCNLTVDGITRKTLEAQNNTLQNNTIIGLNEATHYWNVTCYDNATNTLTSSTNYFNIFRSPIINLTSPLNNSWTNNENVTFYFNVSDDTGIENCSLIINGIINQTKLGEDISNETENNFTTQYLNGTYNWSVQCFDNTSFKIIGYSKNQTLFVDLQTPAPTIQTATNSWFNINTPIISFSISDNMADMLDYSFFIDNTLNKAGQVMNGISTQTGLNPLGEGMHSLILEGRDYATNSLNTTAITIYIDTILPSITLNNPQNGNNTENNSVTFNFTSFDATSTNLTCNITLDNLVVKNINATNSTPSTATIDDLEFGLHYWNVTCLDMALNKNSSATFNFTVPPPDLTLNGTDIWFNETSPKEGTNITINATIYNIGKTTARNFTVQFFDGNWTEGIQIGNVTVDNLTAESNMTINMTWMAKLGQHEIFVILDPNISTNGSLKEENESNNYAFNTIGIVFWHFFSGNVSGTLRIGSQNDTVFTWTITDYNGSNIFAADTDNNINWLNLKELGVNQTNEAEFDDFTELDSALNSTEFSDSINNTFTFNNEPSAKRSFMIFGYNFTNVSVANSTSTNQFLTGILWDTTNATHYNGTQDVAFVTESNTGLGSQGFYDYELRVPATLRDYKGSTQSVSLYTELR